MTALCCLALAAILPQRIVPNKIIYAVNEKGYATACFTNASPAAATAEYVVVERWGIADEGRELARGTVNLGPYAARSVRIAYPGSAHRYGHEIRVKVKGEGEGTSRSEYFAVNTDWWRVAQGCGLEAKEKTLTPLYRQFLEYYGLPVLPARGTGGMLWKDVWARDGWDMGPFPGYCSIVTRWQMQKCSVGGNKAAAAMPDGVTWITPNGSMRRDSGAIREDSDEAHRWGMRHTRFTINLMEGPYGFELARKHPEYMLRNERGQYQGLYMDPRTDPKKISIPDNPERYPWTFVEPNFFRDDVTDWALADLAAAVEGFREDGVYFDGRYVKRMGYDAAGNDLAKTGDAKARQIRNMEKTWKAILDGHPERFIWSNGPNPDAAETYLLNHPRSGLLNELQWGFLFKSTMQCSNWRGFLETMRSSRDMCYVKCGLRPHPGKVHIVGYLCPNWDNPTCGPEGCRERWTASQHAMALTASMLGHPIAGGPQMRNFKQMMMRYSEFFWHEDIEVMKDGYKRFVCDSLREVWYDDMIYRRETEDHVDYYIHLVNVPESEQCDQYVAEDPPEVDDAEVSTKLFGAAGAKAWAIQPSAYLDPVLEPRCREVTAKTVKGETVFAVPPFKYYTLLVIRVEKRPVKPQCAISCESAEAGSKERIK